MLSLKKLHLVPELHIPLIWRTVMLCSMTFCTLHCLCGIAVWDWWDKKVRCWLVPPLPLDLKAII